MWTNTLSCCILLGLAPWTAAYDDINNGLTAIPAGISAAETAINLKQNQIASIDSLPVVFTALSTLQLQNNLLVEFPQLCTVGLTLQMLYLMDNNINVISPSRLDCLVVLTRLYLSGNKLTTIPDVSGPGATLQFLSINDNNFITVPYLPNLGGSVIFFAINSNNITTVTATDLLFPSLMALTLYDMQLETFPDISDLGSSLMQIDFHDNQIEDVPTSILNKMTKLRKIQMHENKLKEFPDLCNSASKDLLTDMDLTGNEITSVPLERLRCLSVISLLWLKNNPMTSFPNVCHMTTTATIKWMMPYSGYMTCDCHARWMKLMQESNNLVIWNPPFKPCSEPAELVGIDLNDLHVDNFTCAGNYSDNAGNNIQLNFLILFMILIFAN